MEAPSAAPADPPVEPEERQEETPHIPLIVVRIQAHTNDVEHFIHDYCRYFGADIVFLPTEGVQPPGRRVRFHFALADDSDVVCGEGVVLRMRRDSGNPARPPGMELRYEVLDQQSQEVVERMLALRTIRATRKRLPEPPPYISMSVAQPRQPPTERVPPPTEKMPTFVVETAPEARPPPARVLPANPLAEISERALGFFVEEAFERMTGPVGRWRRAAGVFTAGLTVGMAAVLALPARPLEPKAGPVARLLSKLPPAAPAGVKQVSPKVEHVLLRVDSLPDGAAVSVDGQPRGRTPLALEVEAGPHRLELQRARYQLVEREVEAPATVMVPLPRPAGRLRVTSTPPGAEVRLRGRGRGLTPLELPTPAFESYTLEIVRDGQTRRRQVYLRPPEALVDVDFSR